MRPVLAIAVWVVILGGLFVYARTRQLLEPPAAETQTIQPLPGEFTLELTPTYDVPEGDDFATVKSDPIVLSLNGREIFRRTQRASAGVPLRVTWNLGTSPVNVGKNEFFVAANPPEEAYLGTPGLRVRLRRDGANVADYTLWGRKGFPVEGPVYLVFPDYMAVGESE